MNNAPAKMFLAIILAGLQMAGGASLGFAAPPPSDKTEEEIVWRKFSAAAKADLTSNDTLTYMKEFLTKFPNHPKAVNLRYTEAERFFKKGDYKSAAVSYEKFLTQHPNHELSDSATFRLGESYYNLKVFNSALTAWDTLVKKFPKSSLVPDALTFLAILNMQGNEWGKTDELFKRLSGNYGEFTQKGPVREKMGVTSYYLGDYSESARVLEGVQEDMAAYYRGLSLFSLKLYDDAVGALKDVELQKEGPYKESAAFLKAEGFFQKKNYTLAQAEFRAFLNRFPSSNLQDYAKLRIAACALLVGEADKALQDTNAVLKSKPTFEITIYATFIKACAALELKDHASAAELFGKVGETGEYPQLAAVSLLRKAWCHKNLNQPESFEKALKILEEKYPSSSQMAMAHFLLAAHLYEKQQWADAGGRFEAALLRYPYSVLSEVELALMAISYTRCNQLDHLVTSANAALKILEGNYSSTSPYWRAQSNYFIGRAYYEMGKYKQAIPFLEKVTIDFSDHLLAPSAQLHLAWCLVETGEYAKAREKADRLIDVPKVDKRLSIHAKFLKAVSYFNGKDYDKAITALSDFVKEYPKDELSPDARYIVGLSYYQKRVYGSAIEEWNKLIDEYPDNNLSKDAYLHIGDLYFKAGKFDEAAKFFKQFQAKWTNTPYNETAMWLEIQSYFNNKDDETAIKVYPVYMEKYPAADNHDDAVKQLEMIYYRRGIQGDPDKLQEFLAKYPKSPFAPSARFKLGDMAMQQKKWNRAVLEMEQFVRDYPNDSQVIEALYGLGQAYENQGETEKAIQQYKNIMERFASKPTGVDAAFRLGMLYFGKELYQEAVDAFTFASKKKMSKDVRANLNYNMALCYENLGQLENAAMAYGRFADDSNNKEQVRDSLLTGGLLLKKAEKFGPAVDFFNRLLKDPGKPETALQAVNMMAECQLAMKNEAAAIKTFEKLVGMEPAGNDVRLAGLAQLAYLYEQKKNFAQAIRVYEKISISDGKAEYVKAAKDRVEALNKTINAAP